MLVLKYFLISKLFNSQENPKIGITLWLFNILTFVTGLLSLTKAKTKIKLKIKKIKNLKCILI